MDLPTFMAQNCDAFFFNAVFGNLHSPRDALLKAANTMKPGAHIVVCCWLARILANTYQYLASPHDSSGSWRRLSNYSCRIKTQSAD